MVSWRVNSWYARRLADVPVGGAPTVAELVVRRFKCLNRQCSAVTFAEQLEGLTSLHARYTSCCAHCSPPSPLVWRAGPVRGSWPR
jgi:hypothetical protein